MKKRNEVAIFEEFRLTNNNIKRPDLEKLNLEKLILYCEIDKDKNPIKYWRKEKDGSFTGVTKFGLYDSGPGKPATKIYGIDTNFWVIRNKYNVPVEWWIKGTCQNYIKLEVDFKKTINQENIKNKNLIFEINSWIRNKAIDEVSLELRKFKKKASDFKKNDLANLIYEQENQIKKNFGLKAIKLTVLAILGIHL